MCLVLAAGWWESSQPEEQLSLDPLQAEFISWWLALPFPATQTLLGNGFSCQKSVINTATGCGLNNRLMVIFLQELPARGLHCPDMQCLSFLSGKGFVWVRFLFHSTWRLLSASPPCHLAFVIWFKTVTVRENRSPVPNLCILQCLQAVQQTSLDAVCWVLELREKRCSNRSRCLSLAPRGHQHLAQLLVF